MGSVAPPGPSGSGNYLDSRVPSEEVLAREFVAMPDAIPGYEFIRDKIFEPEVQFASAGFLTKRDILKKVLELTEEEDRVRDELKRRGGKSISDLRTSFLDPESGSKDRTIRDEIRIITEGSPESREFLEGLVDIVDSVVADRGETDGEGVLQITEGDMEPELDLTDIDEDYEPEQPSTAGELEIDWVEERTDDQDDYSDLELNIIGPEEHERVADLIDLLDLPPDFSRDLLKRSGVHGFLQYLSELYARLDLERSFYAYLSYLVSQSSGLFERSEPGERIYSLAQPDDTFQVQEEVDCVPRSLHNVLSLAHRNDSSNKCPNYEDVDKQTPTGRGTRFRLLGASNLSFLGELGYNASSNATWPVIFRHIEQGTGALVCSVDMHAFAIVGMRYVYERNPRRVFIQAHVVNTLPSEFPGSGGQDTSDGNIRPFWVDMEDIVEALSKDASGRQPPRPDGTVGKDNMLLISWGSDD